jgi:large-conductance mechanosensitive channel
MIRIRMTVLFFALVSLAVAGLNSAIVRFAVILQDRARSGYADAVDGPWDYQFQSFQSRILDSTVCIAVAAAALAFYGAAVAFHPRWLQEHETLLFVFGASQIIVAFIMIVTGGYVADQVHGFQASFDKFSAPGGIPYYSMIYYGSVAQAAYGSVLIFLVIAVVVFVSALDYYEIKHKTKHVTGNAGAIEPTSHRDEEARV